MIKYRVEKSRIDMDLLKKIKSGYKSLKSILSEIEYTEPFDIEKNILTRAKVKLADFLEKNPGLKNDNISPESFLKTDFIQNYRFQDWPEYTEKVNEIKSLIHGLTKQDAIAIEDYKEIEISIFDIEDNSLLQELKQMANHMNSLNDLCEKICRYGQYGQNGGTRRLNFFNLNSTHNRLFNLGNSKIDISNSGYEMIEYAGEYSQKPEKIILKYNEK